MTAGLAPQSAEAEPGCSRIMRGRWQCVMPAGVAQLVEQRIRNAKVEGSTPSTGTTKSNTYPPYPTL